MRWRIRAAAPKREKIKREKITSAPAVRSRAFKAALARMRSSPDRDAAAYL